MSESSRSHVTITLGRSGQVVKRAGAVIDNPYPDSLPSAGTKRSVHDRLGSNVELNNKRHRGNGNILSISSADDVDDEGVPLRKDDLRYKIMQKSGKKGTKGDKPLNRVDLREMLSRQVRPSTTSVGTQQLISSEKNVRQYMPDRGEVRQLMSEPRSARQHMPGHRDTRQRLPDTREVREGMPELREVRERIPEMREFRERMPETREVRERMPETREVREQMPEVREVRERRPGTREVRERRPETREVRERIPERREVRERLPERREVRELMPEARGVRPHMPEPIDDRQRMLEPTSASIMSRAPSSRGVDNTPQIDSFRNSYPPWTFDHLRRRSPDRILGNSRGSSPPRSEEELRRRSSARAFDNIRSAAYLGKDSLDLPTPMGTMTNSALAAGPAKRVGPMLTAPRPPGVIIHKSSYTVDMHALRQMGDNDLRDLGIPMGPRKKILLALLPRSRRQG